MQTQPSLDKIGQTSSTVSNQYFEQTMSGKDEHSNLLELSKLSRQRRKSKIFVDSRTTRHIVEHGEKEVKATLSSLGKLSHVFSKSESSEGPIASVQINLT